MFLSRIFLHLGLIATIILAAPCTSRARDEISSEAVQGAISRAIRHLKQGQKSRGNWTPCRGFSGGVTALCTLALLEAGVPPEDPTVRKAVKYLRTLRNSAEPQTYTIALQTMVYCRIGSPLDRSTIRDNVRWLEAEQISSGPKRGSWGYASGGGDPSNTQFAILALHESALAGFEVNRETWRHTLGYWQRTQRRSGAWGYPPRPGRGSMTCAGIASVIIAERNLIGSDARWVDGNCVCGDPLRNKFVNKGLEWMGRNFSVRHNPIEGRRIGDAIEQNNLYYLYAMERVGRISGKRFFFGPLEKTTGKRHKYDWYREGAAFLLGNQHPDGHWTGGGFAEDNTQIATSFALLFLAKGRRPVLIAKLKRSGDDWNRTPNDLTRLTRYTERKWKMPLTWQVIDSERAGADDYAQTPVLFLSGSEPFQFSTSQRQALRRYVEQGGFIFADGCCGDNGFDASLRNELKAIFPEPEYPLQPLDPQHPIWSIDEKVDPDHVDPEGRWLWGINFACKTSVVYCPGNLSCYWELATPGEKSAPSDSVQREIDTCRSIGINVLAYATNRKLKPKDAIPSTLARLEAEDNETRGHFAIAKLQHAGGCDAAPRAMTHLMESLAHTLDMHTATEIPLISLQDPGLFQYHFVYMHGRHDFRLTPQEKQQLKSFVERGGTVLADSICASPAFTKAFQREMQATFGKPLVSIPSNHPLLTAEYGGADLSQVARRETIRKSDGAGWKILEKRGPVQLDGILVNDRWGVIFSPFDLSCALEKHVSPHCRGYTPEDATRIAINVILYSLLH